MATAGNIKYDVTCGVLEEKKSITLMYMIPDKKKQIMWEWIHQQSDQGAAFHVAAMIGHESQRGHRSQPIPDDDFQKLGVGKPDKSRDGDYYKVKMSRSNEKVSIEKYFNKS